MRASTCFAFLATCGLLAVTSCIGPSNPYDADTPRSLQARARLHGVVTLTGAPVAARISLTEGGASTTTEAGDDGAYSVELSPGTYALLATLDGASEFSRSVVLAPGADVTLDVALDDNVPPQGASILIANGAALTNDATPAIVVDAEGAVAVELSVRTPDGEQSEPVRYQEELPLTIEDFDLGADGTKVVVARFVDENGFEAVAQASIEVDTEAPTLGDNPIEVRSNGGFITSVSTTVSFDVEGASELALTIQAGDAAPEAHGFQPYAPDITVLLPAVECAGPDDADCIEVCATFRDAAGNTTGTPACDQITLDATAPAAPLIIESDVVVNAEAFSLHLVEFDADAFPVSYQVLVDPATPTFAPALEQLDADGNLEVAVALSAPTSTDPATAATPNVVRLRAVDAAGNVSPESSITITVDNVAPATPVLAGAPEETSADTLSVNFGDNPADDDATFDHYSVSTTLLPAPFDSTLRDAILVSLLPETQNDISVVAVDAAGNQSEPATLTIRHDSVPPSAPTIAPIYASARKGPVEIGLVTPSRDTRNLGGMTSETTDVSSYQLKDGLGTGFKPVTAGAPMFADLRTGRENDVCLRGVDSARNVGIEDCVVVVESSLADVSTNLDQIQAFDVFGDFMFFSRNDGGISVRDLRSGEDVVVVGSTGSFHEGGDPYFFASGDPRRAVLAYSSCSERNGPGQDAACAAGLGRLSLIDVQLSQAPVTATVWQIYGSRPYVRGDDLVYLYGNTVRWRSASFPGAADPSQPFTPDAGDLGTAVSNPMQACPGTGPRVANGVIVWCEINGNGEGEIRAYTMGLSALGGEVLSAGPAALRRTGSLIEDAPGLYQQPQVADGMIAWVEESGAGVSVFSERITQNGPDAATLSLFANPENGNPIQVDDLRDLTRGLIAVVAVHNGITSDIALGNLMNGDYDLLNDDTAPQDQPTFDDARLFFSDTARGDLVSVFDRSGLRWVRATSELAFEPVTSTEVTAWVENIGGAIHLVARALPIEAPGHDIVQIDGAGAQQVAFFGPSKADPMFAVGGRRVAYAAGTEPPYSLYLRELDPSGAPSSGVMLANDATTVFAIDPDGDALVYVDATGTIQRIELPTILPATLSVSPVPMIGAGEVTFVDVDDGVIVAQRGGDSRRADSAEGQGAAFCWDGATSAALGAQMRGPKVAHLQNDSYVLAAQVGAAELAARYCDLRCSAPVPCVWRDASSSRGTDAFVQVARDGRIAYHNDDLVLQQIVLFDTFTRRWSFQTLDDVAHTGLSTAAGRIVWSDPSLGSYGVFELTLP